MSETIDYRLLPCPFCGSSRVAINGRGSGYVACQDCGSFGPSATWDRKGSAAAHEAEAHALWNRRRTTLRDELEILIGEWQRHADSPRQTEYGQGTRDALDGAADKLRALIRKHYPQEPQS